MISSERDVFQKDRWRETWAFKDPELQSLSARLRTTILSARSPATVSMYDRAFRRWKEFALRKHELTYFPANPMKVEGSYQNFQERCGRASFSEARAVDECFAQR